MMTTADLKVLSKAGAETSLWKGFACQMGCMDSQSRRHEAADWQLAQIMTVQPGLGSVTMLSVKTAANGAITIATASY
jgi:hypothetical protein